MSPSVDLEEIAEATDGLTGADLQALLYNAHLEVVHDSIAAMDPTEGMTTKKDNDEPLEYFTFGGQPKTKALSKAEESAVQQRVNNTFVTPEAAMF